MTEPCSHCGGTGRATATIDDRLAEVYDRLGGAGLDISTFTTQSRQPPIVIRWRRSYDGVISDEREVEAPSLSAGLRAVIAYEDASDAEELAEERQKR